MTALKAQKKNISYDIVAILAFAALFTWFFYSVKYGVNMIDESYYVNVAKRFAEGDRPLVDEWHVSQLSFLFMILPYRIYVLINGSPEGIMLFGRYFFVSVQAVLYWIIYFTLKKHGYYSIITAVLFCSYIAFADFSENYHTLPQQFLVIIALMIVCKKESRLSLIIMGILFSAAVISEPPLTFAFGIYFVLCIISRPLKNKKFFDDYKFIISVKSFLYVLCGVLISSVVFLVYIQFKSGLSEVFGNIHNLFTDTAYKASYLGPEFLKIKIVNAVRLYGKTGFGLLLSFIPLSYGATKLKLGKRYKFLLMLLYFSVSFWMLIYGLVKRDNFNSLFNNGLVDLYWFYFNSVSVIILLFGVNCYLLCNKRNPRYMFIMVMGDVCSLINDSFSDVSFGLCCSVSYIGVVLSVKDLLYEIKPDKCSKYFKSYAVTAVLVLCLFAFWLTGSTYKVCSYTLIESKLLCSLEHLGEADNTVPVLDTKITKGPYKGIYTVSVINEMYSGIHGEIKYIDSMGNGNIYISSICPNLYITSDLRNASYSSWFRDEDVLSRQRTYWRLHPDKIPDYIYVPVINSFGYYSISKNDETTVELYNSRMEFMDELFEYEKTDLEYGSVLKVTGYKG